VRPKYVVPFQTKPDELKIAELPPEALPKAKAAPGLVAGGLAIDNNAADRAIKPLPSAGRIGYFSAQTMASSRWPRSPASPRNADK
jgi:hypothetical protein